MDAVTAPETLIIFTASPTGLGHIRVMDALMDGLLPGSQFTKIELENIRANKIHALGSRVPILTRFTEFYQTNKIAEFIATMIILPYYKKQTKELKEKLAEIKEQYPNKKRWIIVSTHFALAYPIVEIKQELASKYGVQILNAVVVTDDSPQRIWAIDGSDIVLAPSRDTAERLQEFLNKNSKTIIKAVSFPISPRLKQPLTQEEFQILENQFDPKAKNPLHISIPISGAAVQINFLASLVNILAQDNFQFTIIGQLTSYTKTFFEKVKQIPRAQLAEGTSAKQTVSLYESIFYQGLRPALEITKPSEQCFKAILKPNERGGVILLLTNPVGRQEYDNLNFLIRHLLLPDDNEQKLLEKYLLKDGTLPESERPQWHYKASHWRAVRLPNSPQKAAEFIKKLKQEGILHSMLAYVAQPQVDLTSDGVSQIWKRISEVIK